jgi:hypothetical protein
VSNFTSECEEIFNEEMKIYSNIILESIETIHKKGESFAILYYSEIRNLKKLNGFAVYQFKNNKIERIDVIRGTEFLFNEYETAKFNRIIKNAKESIESYIKKGWWVIDI